VLRLSSRADDWVSNQVFWRGWRGYEPETSPLFFALAERAAVTLDVGAYVGFFTLLAAHASTSGRVFAFEPLRAACERLNRNARINRLDNVECVNAAVGASDGEADFFFQERSSQDAFAGIPCSSSLSLDFMKQVPDLATRRVPVLSLDSYLAKRQVSKVDLIKADTESTEPDVLRGAQGVIARDRPDIVLRGSARSWHRGADRRAALRSRLPLLPPDPARAHRASRQRRRCATSELPLLGTPCRRRAVTVGGGGLVPQARGGRTGYTGSQRRGDPVMTVRELVAQLASLSKAEKAEVVERLAQEISDAWPGVEKSPGVSGGDACIVRTRIAVWQLESYRRLVWTEAKMLANYPSLRAADLVHAWAYVDAHREEIDEAIRQNEDAWLRSTLTRTSHYRLSRLSENSGTTC
jgi:FkbM family methyltransferase